MFAQDRHNPRSGFSIPEWRTSELTRRFREDGFPEGGSSCFKNPIRIDSHYLIRALFHRRRPLRVFTQRKAGHAEDRGFFLHSPGVGENNACAVVERKEIEISER